MAIGYTLKTAHQQPFGCSNRTAFKNTTDKTQPTSFSCKRSSLHFPQPIVPRLRKTSLTSGSTAFTKSYLLHLFSRLSGTELLTLNMHRHRTKQWSCATQSPSVHISVCQTLICTISIFHHPPLWYNYLFQDCFSSMKSSNLEDE